jgi:hypothetical protein
MLAIRYDRVVIGAWRSSWLARSGRVTNLTDNLRQGVRRIWIGRW